MFNIIESFGIYINTESTLATREAANNRLKMLRKRNPEITYWIMERTKVTVLSNKVTVSKI